LDGPSVTGMNRSPGAGEPVRGFSGVPADALPLSSGDGLAWLRDPAASPGRPDPGLAAPATMPPGRAESTSGPAPVHRVPAPPGAGHFGGSLPGVPGIGPPLDGPAAGGVATWLPDGRWVEASDQIAPETADPDRRRRWGLRRGRVPAGGRRVALARFGARVGGWPRRLLVGVLLLGAAAIALRPDPLPSAALAPGAPSTTIVVAARDIPAGQVLTAADLRTVDLPTAIAPSHAARSAATLLGRVAVGPMRRGEPVTDARIVGPGLTAGLAADEAAAVPVRLADPETAALVRVGDRIDVLGAPIDPDGTRPAATGDAVAVASNVRVLAVLGGRNELDGVVVVVAASQPVARRLAGGAGRHRLSVAVRPP
jgi:pilus assembly protein CpaB